MNNHQTTVLPVVTIPPSEQQYALPPIKELFTQSWHTLMKKLSNLVVLNIITFVSSFVILLIIGIIGLVIAFSSGLFNILSHLNDIGVNYEPLTRVHISVWIMFGVLFIGFFAAVMLLGFFSSIAPLLVIHQDEKKLDIGSLVKKVKGLIIPLFLVELIVIFFVWGSFFLFFFPAILVVCFLAFSQFEVIFGGKRGYSALKSSVQMISQHFGEIFIRYLVYSLICIVLFAVIPGIVSKIDKNVGSIFSIFMTVVQWLGGLYGLVFSLTLYKQVKAATDINKKANMNWMVVVSVLGWIIFGIVAFFGIMAGVSAAKSGAMKGYLNKTLGETKQESSLTHIESYIPSNCGFSIPLPDTSESLTKKYRHWIYEERSLSPDSFWNLAPEVTSSEDILGAYFGYKSEDLRFKPEDKSFLSHTGITIKCVNNAKNWTYDEFVTAALQNKKYTVKKSAGEMTWGEAKVYSVSVEGINQAGNYFKNFVNLGVTGDGKKLFVIERWAIEENDPNTKQLNSDINTILGGLKYRVVTTDVQSTKQTQVVPSCKQLNIREGEFANNKCYSQKDYDDLSYYISRFDSAVFSYNGAISSMEITCNGSEFFKNSCEKDKQKKSQAETDMSNYRGIINGIIARGR